MKPWKVQQKGSKKAAKSWENVGKSTISAFGVYKIGQFGRKVRISKDEVPGLKGNIFQPVPRPMLFSFALFSREHFSDKLTISQGPYRI